MPENEIPADVTTMAPIVNPEPVPPDTRPIAEMPFEGGDATRALLTRCGVTEAREIDTLGCTGAAKHGLSIDEIMALRLGLAGGGVGLPCFVGQDRFCLAHNTIGGLQREQLQRYPEQIPAISRELTKKEKGRVAYTEAVRHSPGKGQSVADRIGGAAGALSGYGEMPPGTEIVEDEGDERIENAPFPQAAIAPRPFTCPEHAKFVWTCRFCVAQAIAHGDELEPVFAVCGIPENRPFTPINDASTGITGAELAEEIEAHDKAGAETVHVYALVKTLKRKLA